MSSRPGLVTVRGPFAPLRASVLRSGAPPRGSVAIKEGDPGMRQDPGFQGRYPKPGRMVRTGGAAQSAAPAPSWWCPRVYETSPSRKGRILTSA